MWRRPAQILGLVVSVLGWGMVSCTLAMDRWRVAQLGGQRGSSVVATAWYWSSLWRDCYEDSTAVSNCVDLGVLTGVKGVSDMAGYCLYINRLASAFLHSKADPNKIKYDIGAPVYIGLVGCALLFLASVLYCATARGAILPKRTEGSSGATCILREDPVLVRLEIQSARSPSHSVNRELARQFHKHQMTSGERDSVFMEHNEA